MLGKILLFFVLGITILFSTATAVLFTAFAGSGHGAPKWYMFYLLITQAIPIVTYFFSFIAVLLGMLADKSPNFSARILISSIAVYAASFLGIMLLSATGLLRG